MANGLEKVANILKRLNDEIKLDNDKWEKANGRSDVLPASDARIRNDGNCPYKIDGDNK